MSESVRALRRSRWNANAESREAAFSEDGTVLTLAGNTFDSFTGGPVRLRTVTRIVDEDHFTVEEWFMRPGEREELVVVLHYERKAP